MTRFAYIADTHMGADPMGYEQQKGYPEELREILASLVAFTSSHGGIDFLIHGGDMVDSASDDSIAAAATAFDLPFPVYLCLGNHDLTMWNAADRWLALAPQLFGGGTPDYTITRDDCLIHVVPNHWCERPLFWDGTQQPHFTADQYKRLFNGLNTRPDLPHLIVTHSPVYGLPVEQTGFSQPPRCALVLKGASPLPWRSDSGAGASAELPPCGGTPTRKDFWPALGSSPCRAGVTSSLWDVTVPTDKEAICSGGS